MRAYKIAVTPPMAPVVLVLDGGLQEDPLASDRKLAIPRLTVPVPPQARPRPPAVESIPLLAR